MHLIMVAIKNQLYNKLYKELDHKVLKAAGQGGTHL